MSPKEPVVEAPVCEQGTFVEDLYELICRQQIGKRIIRQAELAAANPAKDDNHE